MTIEEFVIGYLLAALPGTAVSASIPHPMPEEFVTVELVGESETDRIPTARLVVLSWSTSRAASAELADRVKTAMAAAAAEPEISRCSLAAKYNDTDLETNRPRYNTTFEVVYLI